jgi:hypothetical protein
VQGNIDETFQSADVLGLCNTVLRKVLDDEHVRFVWLGRKSPDKLAVARGSDIVLPNLDALSGGQSICWACLARCCDMLTIPERDQRLTCQL